MRAKAKLKYPFRCGGPVVGENDFFSLGRCECQRYVGWDWKLVITSYVLSRYQAFQRSEEILIEIEQLSETLTGFYGKYPNIHLTILSVQIVFAFASLIDVDESNKSQNLTQDKIQGGQPNPSNLKTQWDKTRAYFGGSLKCGVRRWILICSLTIPLWILAYPLVCTCVLINLPRLYPYNIQQFLSLRIYVQWPTSQSCCTHFSISCLL